MAITIDTQAMSMRVQKYLNSSIESVNSSVQRIGSGLRVNSANDDSAGLAIAERMNSILRGMNAEMRNAYDGISISQIAEGGLKQADDLLQRMRELAIQSANGSYSSADRENLNAEFSELNSEVSRIASTTMFNGQKLLSGDGESIDFHAGSGADGVLSIDVADIAPLSTNISTQESSLASVSQIDSLIADVASFRSDFGAVHSRFESTISNLQIGVENQSAARGRIMDADFAVETAMLTRSQMLRDSATAMSSQANVTPESVRQLLG